MVRSLALVLYGNNPRFPWKPSTTMLDNRLTGTRDARRLTATNTHQCHARRPRPAPHDGQHPDANLRAPRCAEGAATARHMCRPAAKDAEPPAGDFDQLTRSGRCRQE
jgi:hypothetical protein